MTQSEPPSLSYRHAIVAFHQKMLPLRDKSVQMTSALGSIDLLFRVHGDFCALGVEYTAPEKSTTTKISECPCGFYRRARLDLLLIDRI